MICQREFRREAISPKRTSGLSRIWYATDEAWEQDLARAKEMPEKIASYKGLLSTDSAKLLEYLRADDDMTVLLESLINYAQRRNDEDTRDAKYQDMVSRLEMLFVDISGAAAFVTPEILSIDDDTMERFFREQPEMELYRLCIDRVRRKRAHILSEAEERIMALTGEMTGSPDNIFSMFNDADLKFPDATDKDGNQAPGNSRKLHSAHAFQRPGAAQIRIREPVRRL